MAKALKLLLIVITPSVVGYAAVSSDVADVFLGSKFSTDVKVILPWIAFAVFLSVIKSYYFDYAFQLVKNTWLQTIPVVIAGFSNLIFNYFFIPSYGIIGAAYATFIAYVFYIILSAFMGSKVFKMPKLPYVFFCKILISVIVMSYSVDSILIESDWIRLMLKIIVGIAAYSLALMALNPLKTLMYASLVKNKFTLILAKKHGLCFLLVGSNLFDNGRSLSVVILFLLFFSR